jgi:Ca2+-binding RTX toxin-like protein
VAAGQIETLEFADGSKLYIEDIISLLGTDGADSITWTGSAVNLNTGTGKDTITSGDFNDTLTGGRDNDTLKGGGGNDTYIFNRGDGQDIINDTAGNDRILFGQGITKDDLLVKLDGTANLIIGLKETGKTIANVSDKITIEKFRKSGELAAGQIETLEFADGSKLYIEDIISLLGTDGADSITWTGSAVNLNTGAGNDTITSGDFNDTLTGGTGNDTLKGGNGDDTYIFNRGDGSDTITDTGGLDRIVFGSDDNIGFLTKSGKLNISYGSGDNIVISSGAVEHYERADGGYLTNSDVNYIIQQITAFGKDKGVSFSTADDVRKNAELAQWIAAQWHNN